MLTAGIGKKRGGSSQNSRVSRARLQSCIIPYSNLCFLYSEKDMELIELGKTPISQNSPSGGDVRFEPEYEKLQNEIDKLTSPTSEGGVNWDNVVQLGTIILAEKSKHLLVASYLCVALVRSRGIEGLEAGLAIYRDLLENFWETLFPAKKRMRGRLGAVEWWKESALSALKSLPPDSSLTEEQIKSLNDNIGAIDTFLGEHIDEAPSLHQLQEMIAGMRSRVDSEDVKQEEAAAQPETQPSPAPAPEAAVAREDRPVIISGQDPKKVLNSGLDALRQAATLFIKSDPSNAISYRLTRLAAWLPVNALPPAQDGKTRIPPPARDLKNALKNLNQQMQYEGLLESAEARVGEFLFWLDLSRYVAEALEQLKYEEACKTVIDETAVYVHRLSGIEKLAFSDGTPFADDDTKEWLKEISIQKASDTGETFVVSRNVAGDSEESQIARVYNKAETLVKQKKVAEGVELIQKQFSQGTSQKSRFLWRIALIRLLVNARKARLALPHLWEIVGDIEKHHLDNWDPDLVLEAMMEVYKSLRAQSDKELQDRAMEAMDHISRLNPVAALRLAKQWE